MVTKNIEAEITVARIDLCVSYSCGANKLNVKQQMLLHDILSKQTERTFRVSFNKNRIVNSVDITEKITNFN